MARLSSRQNTGSVPTLHNHYLSWGQQDLIPLCKVKEGADTDLGYVIFQDLICESALWMGCQPEMQGPLLVENLEGNIEQPGAFRWT